ncbi:MAG TPA: hypothetical protein VGH11_06620 [Jatrophihabitans sp.]|jgi:hypothetical protein
MRVRRAVATLAVLVIVVSGFFLATATSGFADDAQINWDWCGHAGEASGSCSFVEAGHTDYLSAPAQVGETSYNCGRIPLDDNRPWASTVKTRADWGGDDLTDDPGQFNVFTNGLGYTWGHVVKTFAGFTRVRAQPYEKAWITVQVPLRTVRGYFALSLPTWLDGRYEYMYTYTVRANVTGANPNAPLAVNESAVDQPGAVIETHSVRMTSSEYLRRCPMAGVNTAKPDAPGVPRAASIVGTRNVMITPVAAATGVPTDVYLITAQPGGRVCLPHVGEGSCVLSLDPGVYTFTAQAFNFNGSSQTSRPSNPVAVFR